MSNRKIQKREKIEQDSEVNASDEINREDATENESLKLQPSTSYYTANSSSESIAESAQLPTPSQFPFLSTNLDVQHAEPKANDEEEKIKSQASLHNIQSPKKPASKESSIDVSKNTELHTEPSPVRFKSLESEKSPDGTSLHNIPSPKKSSLKENFVDVPKTIELQSSPVRFMPIENEKGVDAPRQSLLNVSSRGTNESISKSMRKQDSLKSVRKSTSPFSTNLDMGEAFVYMVLPPDGGYGWFIVLISFIMQVIIDGIVFSVGVILPVIGADLNVNPSKAVLISGLQVAFYYLSGPVTSAIINKYGFRQVALIGATGATLCLLISSFSPNMEMLLVFYSCLGGPMFSMVWASSQLIVGYYFEKYRPIASGLSCSGSGVGIFMFGELNSHFVEQFGWRNNTRIQAGFTMITFLLGFAFLEVAPSKIGIMREKKEIEVSSDSSPDERELSSFMYADAAAIRLADHSVDYYQIESLPITETMKFKSREPNCLKKLCKKCACRDLEYGDDRSEDGVRRIVIKKDIIDKQDLFYTGPPEYADHDKSTKREVISGRDVELIEDEKSVAAINYTFSMQTLRRPTGDTKLFEDRRCCGCVKASYFPKKIKNAFLMLFNFELFRLMDFRILFVSAFCYSLGLNIPYLFSKERADLNSTDKNLIPAVIGASNFFSRLLSGFAAFGFRRHVSYICGSAIFGSGLVTILSAFWGLDVFWFQMFYAACFGMAPGFFSSLRAIIYVKYLGLQNLTNAFGLIAMGMGTGVFLGSVLSGFLNHVSGSFMVSFVFSGVCLTTSGLLKLILPTISRKPQK